MGWEGMEDTIIFSTLGLKRGSGRGLIQLLPTPRVQEKA